MLKVEQVRANYAESLPVPERKWKLAVLLSHPIQYHVPLMRKLAKLDAIDLSVFFMTDTGLREKRIKDYGETIKWDVPVLDGYKSKFLTNRSLSPNKPTFWSKLNPGIVKELKRERFDAVMLHGYSSLTEWLALLRARSLNLPILFRGEVVLQEPRVFVGPRWLRNALFTFWCKRITAALPINSAAVEFYRQYGVPDNHQFWAPYSVDNEYWFARARELKSRRNELKLTLGLDPKLPVVLFVAHMRENKRPVDVLRAFEQLKTPASLVMVGSGPRFGEVEEYISSRGIKRVFLAGVKNQTELPDYYAIADLFVLASGPGEVSPLVVNESMCFGMPVILSDAIPSARDFVKDSHNGFVYEMGNVAELSQRMDYVLNDPAVIEEMGRNSRRIIERWNYDSCIDAILQALKAATVN